MSVLAPSPQVTSASKVQPVVSPLLYRLKETLGFELVQSAESVKHSVESDLEIPGVAMPSTGLATAVPAMAACTELADVRIKVRLQHAVQVVGSESLDIASDRAEQAGARQVPIRAATAGPAAATRLP
jgi:hypothetical protein